MIQQLLKGLSRVRSSRVLAPQSLGPLMTTTRLFQVDAEAKDLRRSLREVEEEIKQCTRSLERALREGDRVLAKFYMDEKLKLRDKELKLRDEKLKLRDEKLKLRDEKLKLREKELKLLEEKPKAPDPAVVRFYAAIQSMDYDFRTGRHIVLPDGVEWPRLASSTLFVRHFYGPLYESVLGGLDGTKTKPFSKFIICGNPGIGKSAFGLYCLFRALKDGRRVVYQSEKLNAAYIFSEGVVRRVDPMPPAGSIVELFDPSTVFISDSICPPSVSAFSVFITSPKRSRWWEYSKDPDVRMFYVPVFSKKEILDCRATCFPQLPVGEVLERFAKWGGIPRYVLANLGHQAQMQLQAAVAEATLEQLASAMRSGINTEYHHGPSRLVHIKVAGEVAMEDVDSTPLSPHDARYYMMMGAELGSRYIAGALLQEWGTRADDFIYQCRSQPSVAALLGSIFEERALEIMAAGGTFKRVRLDTGKRDTVTLSPSTVACFVTLQELASRLKEDGDKTMLYRPSSSNFCAIDAILPGRLLANATLSKRHDIVLEKGTQKDGASGEKPVPGLISVVQALGLDNQSEIPFAWLIPDYSTITAGPFKIGGRGVDGHDVAARVVQYAIMVPISPEARAGKGR